MQQGRKPEPLQQGPVARLGDLRQRLIGYNLVNLRRHIDEFATVRSGAVTLMVPTQELAARVRGAGAEPVMGNLRDVLMRRRHMAGFQPFAPSTVIDAGARYGLFAVMARLTWPMAEIRVLEADPRYEGAIDMSAIANGIDAQGLSIAPHGTALAELLAAADAIDFLKVDADGPLCEAMLAMDGCWQRVARTAVRFDSAVPAGLRLRVEQVLSRAGLRTAMDGTAARMRQGFLPDLIYGSRCGDLLI